MEKTKRLSLEDFKLMKLQGSNGIDKLIGGSDIDTADDFAADCHIAPTMKVGATQIYFIDDPVQ